MNPVERPRLVATIAARTLRDARREIRAAAREGAEIAEIRWDRLPEGSWDHREELAGAALPLWAAYRSRAEGGAGVSERRRRQEILTALAGPPFDFLDLEYRRDLPAGAALAGRLAAPGAPRPVVSYHGEAAPGGPAPLVAEMAREGAIVKVVLAADTEDFLDRVLPGWPPGPLGRSVVLTTGGSGAILRAGARRLGLGYVFARSGSAAEAVEPAQLPVAPMRWFLDGPADAPLFAVVGRPVGRSRSPELHYRWMRRAGLRGLYSAIEIGSPGGLARALPFFARSGYRGLNVTAPLKRAAFELADRREPSAAGAGAANTLTFREGRTVAANTDVAALLQWTEERLGPGGGRRRWTVLGAGGAARAALAAARAAGGTAEVRARDGARARTLAREFGAETPVGAGPRAEILIQATPAGTAGAGPLAISTEGLLGPDTWVLDLVYDPVDRSLADRARRAGARYEEGGRVLLLQAAASFAIWWGRPPPGGIGTEPGTAEGGP